MGNIQLSEFSLNTPFNSEDAANALYRFGACVYPSFVEQSELEPLKQEFAKLLDDKNAGYVFQISYPPGAAASLNRREMPKNCYPAIDRLFSNDQMRVLCEKYVGYGCDVNYEVYATHEIRKNVSIAPTHFDKLFTLKFMIYLKDVGPRNGPFGIIPKSTPVARERFREIFSKNNISELDLSSPEYSAMDNKSLVGTTQGVVDIVGPAGTMIIFDSDTFHHAGSVDDGKERLILRGHSGIGIPGLTYKSVKKDSFQYWRGEKPNEPKKSLLQKIFAS